MTYNEKKFLYESIMKEAAKIVKKQINEAGVESFRSENGALAQHLSSFNKTVMDASNIISIAGPILTIIDLLKDMVTKQQDDMI